MNTIYGVIRYPVLTERSTDLRERLNKVTLVVDPKANKVEIKRAVEETLKVKVVKVNILRMEGKRKRLGRFEGKRSDWKKAVVTLKEGEKLGIFENA
ncbi:MAG: 50S ribosomal protein L23 [Nitrospirae bacterium]|nr:50S ribosomal protein L23 [Nitrospirota bacterium]